MSKEQKRLLLKLDAIMCECYNGNIQNYGPGGQWEDEGRWFDYPTWFEWSDGTMHKNSIPDSDDPDEEVLMSGHYKFGANVLPVYRNLAAVLQYLEDNYGLVIDDEA